MHQPSANSVLLWSCYKLIKYLIKIEENILWTSYYEWFISVVYPSLSSWSLPSQFPTTAIHENWTLGEQEVTWMLLPATITAQIGDFWASYTTYLLPKLFHCDKFVRKLWPCNWLQNIMVIIPSVSHSVFHVYTFLDKTNAKANSFMCKHYYSPLFQIINFHFNAYRSVNTALLVQGFSRIPVFIWFSVSSSLILSFGTQDDRQTS